MPSLWRNWFLCLLSTAPLGGALLAVVWLGGRFLPNLVSIKAAAGIAAAAFGLIQAQALIYAVSSTWESGLLTQERKDFIFAWSPPPDFSRGAARVLLAVVWLALSQPLAGGILNATVGGDLRWRMVFDLALTRDKIAEYRRLHAGEYPPRLEGLLIQGLPAAIPPAWSSKSDYARRLFPHPPGSGVEHYGNEVCRGSTNAHISPVSLRDTGRWGYVQDPKSPCFGQVFIDCTHKDFAGRLWADY